MRELISLAQVKRKATLIVLLGIVTINSFSLHHIFKIPVLVAHYFEHQQRGPEITVMEFLSMHYWGQDIDDNDQDRDMQLPFKKFDLSQSVTTLFFNQGSQFNFKNFPLEQSYPVIDSEDRISQNVGSLFKPPRQS